jgi:hypothetical protein
MFLRKILSLVLDGATGDAVASAHGAKSKEAYTVAEVAALTGFSRQTVTRLFEKEPGGLILKRPTTNPKRRYRSIRIPRPVFDRVIRGLTAK